MEIKHTILIILIVAGALYLYYPQEFLSALATLRGAKLPELPIQQADVNQPVTAEGTPTVTNNNPSVAPNNTINIVAESGGKVKVIYGYVTQKVKCAINEDCIKEYGPKAICNLISGNCEATI